MNLFRLAVALGVAVLMGAAWAAEPGTAKKAPKKGARPDFWTQRFKSERFDSRGIEGFRQETIQSRKLRFKGDAETPVGVAVYLPPGYERSADRFPVLYLLHGLGGTEATSSIVVPKAHELMKAGALRPFLIVAPNGGRAFYGNQFEGKCQVHDFFFEELVPHIDATYRTRAEKAGRQIQGFSMGGYGAMMFAAKHPEIFGAAMDIAGALQGARFNVWREMYDGKEEHYRPYDLWLLADANKAALRTMPLSIWVGSEDICLRVSEQFHAELTRLEIPHEFNGAKERPKLEGVPHDLARYYELYGTEILKWHAERFGR